jgi:hypothetical protein
MSETSDYAEEVFELLDQSQIADDRAKIDLIERAIQLCDSHNDAELGLDARAAMVEAGTWEGFPEQQMLAFQWILAQLDRNPSLHDEWGRTTLYRYKWVAAHLGEFSSISIDRIRKVLDDMQRRYEAAGASLRPLYQQWCTNLGRLGDLQASMEYQAKWNDAPRDDLADCKACELSEMVNRELDRKSFGSALEMARPLLRGELTCGEQPHVTESALLVPMLLAGMVKEAAAAQAHSQRMMFDSRSYCAEMGMHFMYLGLTSQWTKGVKLFQKRLPWGIQARNHYRRMYFWLGAGVFFARMASEKSSVKMTLPETFPAYRSDAQYAPRDVADALLHEVDQVAAAFDRRNGNQVVSERVRDARALIELPRVPLTAP